MDKKEAAKQNERAIDLAGKTTLLAWGLILLVNAIFESLPNTTFTLSSMMILLIGMIVFFASYIVFNRPEEKKKQDD